MQIYAIYFHFSGVGRGAAGKDPQKITIALQTLGISCVTISAAGRKYADLLGNRTIFEIQKNVPILVLERFSHPRR
jgi:hypothetical protein